MNEVWNLDRMYAGFDDPKYLSDFEAFEKKVKEFVDFSKTLENAEPLEGLRTGIRLQEGVYLMYSGPNYETPAEIRMFRTFGADAVGMSTVPEALVAGQCGMQVAGVSCITNMAAGVLPQKLSHQEVLETAAQVHDKFRTLLELILTVLKP